MACRRNWWCMDIRSILKLTLLHLVVLGFGGRSAFAQPDNDKVVQGAALSAVSFDSVPAVFKQPTPRTVNDMRAMQDHLVAIVPKLAECTVNIRVGHAQGSGVLVSSDGLVLSAAHVTARPGQKLTIVTSDGKRHEGVTLGRNSAMDASMVQIISDRTDWPYCKLSPLEKVELGEWCLVLGHPGGLDEDRGLVLRLGRVIFQNHWMIQTDCELIGGDSGGPLFDMNGHVIGINTRIGESTQYNFHVPASTYVKSWDRLVAAEDFRTHTGAYLGISGTPNTTGNGLLITNVYPNDPAAKAGIQAGDILLTFKGEKVTDLKQLVELVGQEFAGETALLGLLREGKEIELKVRLGMRID